MIFRKSLVIRERRRYEKAVDAFLRAIITESVGDENTNTILSHPDVVLARVGAIDAFADYCLSEAVQHMHHLMRTLARHESAWWRNRIDAMNSRFPPEPPVLVPAMTSAANTKPAERQRRQAQMDPDFSTFASRPLVVLLMLTGYLFVRRVTRRRRHAKRTQQSQPKWPPTAYP